MTAEVTAVEERAKAHTATRDASVHCELKREEKTEADQMHQASVQMLNRAKDARQQCEVEVGTATKANPAIRVRVRVRSNQGKSCDPGAALRLSCPFDMLMRLWVKAKSAAKQEEQRALQASCSRVYAMPYHAEHNHVV